MIWFRRKHDENKEELIVAYEQLARTEAAQEHVKNLRDELAQHMQQNRFGDRLFLEMARTRRRRHA